MTQENTPQHELIRFFQILFRKKWLILFCIIIAIAPCFYLNKITTPAYQATSQLVYEFKQTGITDIAIAPFDMNGTYIKNITQEIESWSLINEVVLAMPISMLATYVSKEQEGIELTKEDFTDILRKKISASSIPKSDIILIHAEASEPKTAAKVANLTADILIEKNLKARLGEVHSTKETIQDQLKVYRDRVAQSESKLRDYKESHQINNLEQESSGIFRRVTEAEIEFNKISTDLNSLHERLSFIKKQLNETREGLIPAITTVTSPWIQKLKEQLVSLEVQYTTLQVQDYTDNHPKMQALSKQIEETKKSLREETLKIAKGENTIDPLSKIQKDLEEISYLQVEIHTYTARKNAIRNVLDSYNRELNTLPEKELKLGQLIRDKAVADKIYTMLLEKYEEARISEAEKIANLRIIDQARPPKAPIRPNKMLNLMLGAFLGGIFGIILALIIETFNIKIRTEEDVEKHMKLPVLGTIPKIKNTMTFITHKGHKHKDHEGIDSKLITILRPNSPVSEAFRILRTNIQISQTEKHAKSFIVTSTHPQEGKSIISANLAATTAQLGFKTLLVDADLRKPTLHFIFRLPMQPGLTNLFISDSKKKQSAKEHINYMTRRDPNDKYIPFIHTTSLKNLYITTSGKIPMNPSELLASQKMLKSIDALKENFDIIIYDMPPINIVTDAAIMAKQVDGVLFVVRAGKTKLDQLLKAKKTLIRMAKNKITGVVLNNVDVKDSYIGLYAQMKSYGETKAYIKNNGKKNKQANQKLK